MPASQPFYQRIRLLTGHSLDPKSRSLSVKFSPQYAALFGSRKNIDISEVIKLVDDTLLRKEEIGDVYLDKFGRFDHDKSILVRNALDQSPIIDELIFDIIKQANMPIRNIWPDGKRAAVCLTHDVDAFDGTSYLALRKLFWLAKSMQKLYGFKIGESKKYLQNMRKWHNIKKDPIFAFDRWMGLESKYGFRSTFFFMALNKALSREGRRYSYRNPLVGRVVRELKGAGWEVGLHAARYNNMDVDYLKKQKDRLEQIIGEEIIGCRHHWLRVRLPKSWCLYRTAGLKYSSNVGWDLGYNGFRAGTSIPYWPLFSDRHENNRLLEIPFHLIDSSDIADPLKYEELFLSYLIKIKIVGGCLTLVFHQEYFDEDVAPNVGRLYERILKILSNDKDIFVARLQDVYQHLNKLVAN
jgi:peptidoglycan/xylan/chitin deacetylase (PgdA/CDA1 family)